MNFVPRAEAPAFNVTRDWVRALQATQRLRDRPDATLAMIVAEQATLQGEAPALIGETSRMSFAELAAQANRVARLALAQDLPQGAVIALLMPNTPEYVATWLGLTQIGCVVALLSTQLAPGALAHCMRAAGAVRLIAPDAMRETAEQTLALLPGMEIWTADAAAAMSGAPLEPHERRAPAGRDCALLIYTSGTTGLPKAAKVSHSRIMEWSHWFAGMTDMRPADRLYDCLPLYHSVGGVVAVGAALVGGASVVLRERFSARRFWQDVVETECTIVQYIGELCRYLLHTPASPSETAHRLRLFCGNGLRGDVWEALQARFAIPRIIEFYAATESNISLYNLEGKPGAIGRVPPFLAHRFPIALIRHDPVSGEPLRDADGRCMACGVDEPGEAIGRIGGASDEPARRFDGYVDRAASEKKILRDVFAPGDRWFRTGDLMRRDTEGFYSFLDRLGDTFRWQGENVSTAEVASVAAACPGVTDAAVFGVPVPGAEGKAGMAALVVDESFDLAQFRRQVAARLPGYARPRFVRLCGAMEMTGTFRLKKSGLAAEGYADSGADPVWFDDGQAYVRCDAALVDRLRAGSIRL